SSQEIAALVPRPEPETRPRLSYDMENLTADGRMRDLSRNGNHGTITGTTDVAGKVGRAREFDGVDDVIESPFFFRSANGTFAMRSEERRAGTACTSGA